MVKLQFLKLFIFKIQYIVPLQELLRSNQSLFILLHFISSFILIALIKLSIKHFKEIINLKVLEFKFKVILLLLWIQLKHMVLINLITINLILIYFILIFIIIFHSL